MTITSSSPRTKRRPRSTGSAPGSGRSGAASRAYERRQQRAVSLGGESVSGSHATARTGLSTTAITARIPFVALIIGLLSLGLGLTLLLTTRSAGDSYDLSEAKLQNERLVQERASLQRDVELADSAPELARKAAELGMIPALNAARIVVGEDGAIQVVGTPAPAQGNPVAPLDPVESQGTSQSSNSEARNSLQPRNQASSPARSASAPGGTRSASGSSGTVIPPVTSATPNASNNAPSAALGEQLVPMSIPSASPSDSRQ
ncbi:MAG: hypothetical protein WBA81_22690 [Rhodococcus sp. (in: high G+C Gram-positive bacteria)]